MLNDREKVGELNLDWKEYAFGKGKTKRKTWGFGVFNKKEKAWSDFEVYLLSFHIYFYFFF